MKKISYPVLVLIGFSIFFWWFPSTVKNSHGFQKTLKDTRDTFFKIRERSATRPTVLSDAVLVAIDEESTARLNARWPWSRRTFADLIDRLREGGARVIGLNVSFTGLEDGSDASSQDLARAMKAHGRVVIGVTFDRSNHLVKPSPLIAEAVRSYGYLEKIVDEDLLIRKSYPVRPYAAGGSFETSFPFQVFAAQTDENAGELHFDPELNLVTVGQPSRSVALGADGSYTINYLAGPAAFRRIPAWRVVQGKIAGDDVKGKTVFVGLSSSIFSDVHQTPLGMLPGIAVHANEWLSLASGRPLRFVPDGITLFISWLAALCVLGLFLLRRFWMGFVGFALAFGGFFLGAGIAFERDIIIEPFLFLMGPLLGMVAGVLAHSIKLLVDNKGLEKKVIHDKMTGLYKYEYLRECLDQEWKRCQNASLPLSVVMADLDRFKRINDTLGHEAGNRMIKKAGEAIRESARRYDIVSRYGGDEFVVLLWHANLAEAQAYRDRLRQLYHAMAQTLDQPLLKSSSISIGVAAYDPGIDPNFPPTAQRLLEEADRDLMLDKEKRRVPGEPAR